MSTNKFSIEQDGGESYPVSANSMIQAFAGLESIVVFEDGQFSDSSIKIEAIKHEDSIILVKSTSFVWEGAGCIYEVISLKELMHIGLNADEIHLERFLEGLEALANFSA
jgi:hypothetical protein